LSGDAALPRFAESPGFPVDDSEAGGDIQVENGFQVFDEVRMTERNASSSRRDA
jgi:hypothetical protein